MASLENEMSNLNMQKGKTAVSVLQEMMQKRGAEVPSYKEKGSIGPPFKVICHLDELETEV